MEVENIISSGLLELYVSGLTSETESSDVEMYAQKYPQVKQEILLIQEAFEAYATSNAIQPHPSLKNKILAKIGEPSGQSVSRLNEGYPDQSRPAVIRKLSQGYKFAAAASIILLIISAVIGYDYYNKFQDANNKLQVAERKLEQESQIAQAMHSDIDVMSNKYSLPVVLNGTAHTPDALAKIFWMKNSGEVWVDAENLPDLPAGNQYQLWAIVAGKPVDAGTISTNKGMLHLQRMKSFGKAEAFAITMEKSGGSPTPTMDKMVVIAKI